MPWPLDITMSPSIYCVYSLVLVLCNDHIICHCCPPLALSGSSNNQYNNQLVQFDTATGTFIDYGVKYINETMGCDNGMYFWWGIYYTQINGATLYALSSHAGVMNVFDLQSLSYHDLGTSIPSNVQMYACTSSSNTPVPILYITGAPYILSLPQDVQFLRFDTMEWLSAPSMLNARRYHGCIVANDRLWAIGGSYSDSAEAINTTNIVNATWQLVGALTCPAFFGITSVDDLIFVIGGYCYDNSTVSRHVQTIDTVTDTISIFEYSLPYGVRSIAVVAIDHTIYGFGGNSGTSFLDSWLTLEMLRVPFAMEISE